MRTPVIRTGAIIPDASLSGPSGTIPVGGGMASEAIHPGMHSADICCSMAISVFDKVAPKALLDAVHGVTHFGPGGRQHGKQWWAPAELLAGFEANPLLSDGIGQAMEHFGTHGNYFAYVGSRVNRRRAGAIQSKQGWPRVSGLGAPDWWCGGQTPASWVPRRGNRPLGHGAGESEVSREWSTGDTVEWC